jgi:YceI-like domain.
MFINLLATVFWLFNLNGTNTIILKYRIVEPSALSISGNSNINSFECTSFLGFNDGSATMLLQKNGRSLNFSNASINLQVKSFDCKNNLINRDFYHTLNADTNPIIRIDLKQVETAGEPSKVKWSTFNSKVTITLNQVSQDMEIGLKGFESKAGEYHVCGSTQLLMSDFGIKPPTAMLGLIKTENKITISFDLFLQTQPTIQ